MNVVNMRNDEQSEEWSNYNTTRNEVTIYSRLEPIKTKPSQGSKKYTAVEQQSQKRPIFLVVNGLIGDIFHNKQLSYQHKQGHIFLVGNGF
jgi:hypothetical protein